jgi:hypothetical protein
MNLFARERRPDTLDLDFDGFAGLNPSSENASWSDGCS